MPQEKVNAPPEKHALEVYRGWYQGSGTAQDPFIVDWNVDDPENPRNWRLAKKWTTTAQIALGTYTVTIGSSCYSAGISSVMDDLHVSKQLAGLGLSLYVLGFGLGPLLFAPLSEMYGRRLVFLCTFAPFTLLHLGGALAHNLPTLLITRFLGGTIGSSPLANGGGAVSDIWSPQDRALATTLYSVGPFLGPATGPIVGGYISQSKLTWRFSFWIMFIMSSILFIAGVLNMPESYAPVLLRRRAQNLQKKEGNHIYFISVHDIGTQLSPLRSISVSLLRPFVLLFTEPTVTVLAIYISLVYATLYAFFSAFPIVFEEHKHFSSGKGGLAFLGIGIGNFVGVLLNPITRNLYNKSMRKSPDGIAPPEARLVMGMVGAVTYPIGIFWFAWTTFPSISPIVPIVAGFPFGLGMLLIFNSITSYIMDAYPLYCASAIAATVVLRSILAALFPFFTPPMYKALGDQWASGIFAFVSAICTPMPFLFYRYGGWIRSKSKYAMAANDLEKKAQGIGNGNGPPENTGTAVPITQAKGAIV